MGKTRANQVDKTVCLVGDSWETVDTKLEISIQQKFAVFDEKLIILGMDLKKVEAWDMKTGSMEVVELSYQRKDKLDDKKPKRDRYGIGLAKNYTVVTSKKGMEMDLGVMLLRLDFTQTFEYGLKLANSFSPYSPIRKQNLHFWWLQCFRFVKVR